MGVRVEKKSDWDLDLDLDLGVEKGRNIEKEIRNEVIAGESVENYLFVLRTP